MSYAQNGEDAYILSHFNNFTGKLLDIGCHDLVTFSNTRQLALNGWDGVYYEASSLVFPAIERNKEGIKGEIFNTAVHPTHSGTLEFYLSADCISTSDPAHMEKWKSYANYSEPVSVPCINAEDLFLKHGDTFDMINIDVEGYSFLLFERMFSLFENCRLWCVEADGKHSQIEIMGKSRGFNVLCSNGENVVIGR